MISLDKIVSNNLEMLKSQEADLLKSLSFVQKAKQLFLAHWGKGAGTSTGKKSGRPGRKKNPATPKVAAAPRKKTRKTAVKAKRSAKPGVKRVSHLTNVLSVLRQSGKPMTSGDLISALFKKQTADKDIRHFRLLIYPVLTKAYASKTLILKDGKIYLPK
jgi:hypothetical protein